MIWVHVKYLNSESRSDCCDPGSQIGKESPPWYTQTVSVMLLLPVMPIVYFREKKKFLITRKENIKTSCPVGDNIR